MKQRTGLLDAGVVLRLLDRRHRSQQRIRALFEGSRAGRGSLFISAVNLAEVFQHSRRYTEATGLDPLALLLAFLVRVHSPDAAVARRAAELAAEEDASLADRFAMATAEILRARLYTTDSTLARAASRRRLPCSLFR